MVDAVVEAHALTRNYGPRTAVHELSLTLARGEIVALLGPNGAGKTTTLRMLAGLIQPSSGTVRRHGTTGLLTETPGLWDSLSVRLNLLTHARLHGLSMAATRVTQVLTTLQLADRADDRAGELSKGLRQRVALARTLLHDPALLLLDEPTSGLDPATARQVRDLILALRHAGRGILISTHNLTEAEALADRIGILKVRLLALDAPQCLRQGRSGARVDIEVEGDAVRWVPALEHRTGLRVAAHDSSLTVALADLTVVPDLISLLVTAGARVTRVAPQNRSLEDVYLELVGH